jgi:hypothetical protein
MWLDSGEVDGKSSLYILAVFPMNAPASMLRRPDCLFPIGYVYHASDIVDCFEALLSEFLALRDKPRSIRGISKALVVELDLLAADNPAITKLLRLMESAKANFPCKDCEIISNQHLGLFLNDPDRWNAPLRTQEASERNILRMIADRRVLPKETGDCDKYQREQK